MKNIQIVDPDRHANRIMEQMKADLRMPVEPRHIECFDNSNIQEQTRLAPALFFKNGKPSKKDYRNFNIETVVGPDDFASMEKYFTRRYSRQQREGEPLPQLIIIQWRQRPTQRSAKKFRTTGFARKNYHNWHCKAVRRSLFREIRCLYTFDKRSETLKVIQQARNEAHRFGITHHRKRREKSTIKSELESAPAGIGPAAIKDLLTHFKSVKAVRNASVKELEVVIGLSKAQKILAFFEQKLP